MTRPRTPKPGTTPTFTAPAIPTADVLSRLDALKTADIAALKAQWRALFGTEPPPYNRRFLESRLAYRVQELAFGGLKPATIARLEALGEQFDGGKITVRRMRGDDRPIAGTQLIREYQGVEHLVTTRVRSRGGDLGDGERHGGVIGPLPGLPAEASAAHHGDLEIGSTGRTELIGRAEGVSGCGAEQNPAGAVKLSSCVGHG